MLRARGGESTLPGFGSSTSVPISRDRHGRKAKWKKYLRIGGLVCGAILALWLVVYGLSALVGTFSSSSSLSATPETTPVYTISELEQRIQKRERALRDEFDRRLQEKQSVFDRTLSRERAAARQSDTSRTEELSTLRKQHEEAVKETQRRDAELGIAQESLRLEQSRAEELVAQAQGHYRDTLSCQQELRFCQESLHMLEREKQARVMGNQDMADKLRQDMQKQHFRDQDVDTRWHEWERQQQQEATDWVNSHKRDWQQQAAGGQGAGAAGASSGAGTAGSAGTTQQGDAAKDPWASLYDSQWDNTYF
ncbi:MAG: hypothetical protein MHM6MM_000817 [Cercozoa sp. M6MM]